MKQCCAHRKHSLKLVSVNMNEATWNGFGFCKTFVACFFLFSSFLKESYKKNAF